MAHGVTNGFKALGTNPLRTALSTLGVVIGVGSLVAILALGDGLERFSRQQLEQTTDLHTIQVVPRTTQFVDGLSVRRDEVRSVTGEDADGLRAVLGTGFAVARSATRAARATAPDSVRPTGIYVMAMDPPDPRMLPENLREGLLPDTVSPDGVALSAAAERVFFPGGNAIGSTLRLDTLTFRVTGVFEGKPDRRPIGVLVALNERTHGWMIESGRPVALQARATLIEDVEPGTARIEAWAHEHGADALDVQSSRARVQQASQAMLVFKLGMAAIAAISLIVGGIGIMNVLLASVSERTREIGVRKAVGATRTDIRFQFLAESVAIAGLGSGLGILLGMGTALGVAAIIRSLTDAPVTAAFTWQSLVAAVGSALLVGLVFGTYPARRASRLSPIDAIRHE